MLNKLKNLTILCVEDNIGVRKRLVNTLNFYFQDVIEVSDGKEAYDAYQKSKIDVIITDIDMPNINGIELIKKIRKENVDIPIIVLTAYSNEEYLLELINLKINHFILKPINAQKLQNALQDIFTDIDTIKIDEILYINLNSMEIMSSGVATKITNKERLFLKLLYKNKSNVTKYQNIQDCVWQNDIMSQSALKTFIKVLRKKFPKEVIENISGVGYRFCFYI
ncbi:MAG: response regulator transcription factor [Epsilonproteobacteria bacterium]|nr:response regulator transcription factor [Campylobacterota bacterium]